MKNCPSHKSKKVLTEIQNLNIKIRFLPTYSSNFAQKRFDWHSLSLNLQVHKDAEN